MLQFKKSAGAFLLSLIILLSFSRCKDTQTNEKKFESSSHLGQSSEQPIYERSKEENLKNSKSSERSSSNQNNTLLAEEGSNYNDLITPFVYTLSGDELSDEQIKVGFITLYNSAHDVFYWYYNDSGPLNTNFEVPKIEDDQGETWFPVTRLKALSELNQITESVFSKRFSNYALYRLRRFNDIDGKLYERAGGGLGDSCAPDFNSIEILSKTQEVITLYINLNVEVMVNKIRVDKTEFTLLKQNGYWVLDNWI